MCINVAVFDAIAAHGHVTISKTCALLPGIPASCVTSAIHRLSIGGSIRMQRMGRKIIYSAKPGSHPTDKRGRPRRIAVAPRSETSG
jgi:hypothetical protein